MQILRWISRVKHCFNICPPLFPLYIMWFAYHFNITGISNLLAINTLSTSGAHMRKSEIANFCQFFCHADHAWPCSLKEKWLVQKEVVLSQNLRIYLTFCIFVSETRCSYRRKLGITLPVVPCKLSEDFLECSTSPRFFPCFRKILKFLVHWNLKNNKQSLRSFEG